jgi:3-dehydroquinate synthase
MKTITVNTSSEYRVLVGQGLLAQIGTEIRKISNPSKIAIISDSNVWPLYGEIICNHLSVTGFTNIISYTIPAGEQSKNGETFLSLLEFLAENHLTRSDCIIALGGGVVGDLAGFTAASFLRGIDYIQIPTTLLACVDSSVGGKTAIDLKAGKNLAGAFYQPKLVLCDIDTLNTLPAKIFRDGCAEVIKYGVLYDGELFNHLTKHGIDFDREWVISRCISLKMHVVCNDEFDRGERQKLNLGHTIGHGVEANSNYTISHGEAVAVGMAIVSRAATTYGICEKTTNNRILTILDIFGLPDKTEFSAEAIYLAALNDKKRFGGTVNLIVPKTIGDCIIHPISVDDLKPFIEAGL